MDLFINFIFMNKNLELCQYSYLVESPFLYSCISIFRQGNARMLFHQSVTGLQRVLAYIVFVNTKCK